MQAPRGVCSTTCFLMSRVPPLAIVLCASISYISFWLCTARSRLLPLASLALIWYIRCVAPRVRLVLADLWFAADAIKGRGLLPQGCRLYRIPPCLSARAKCPRRAYCLTVLRNQPIPTLSPVRPTGEYGILPFCLILTGPPTSYFEDRLHLFALFRPLYPSSFRLSYTSVSVSTSTCAIFEHYLVCLP